MNWFLDSGWWIITIVIILIDEINIYLNKQRRRRMKECEKTLDNLFKNKRG